MTPHARFLHALELTHVAYIVAGVVLGLLVRRLRRTLESIAAKLAAW